MLRMLVRKKKKDMEQNKDNKRWIMIAITTVMIILIGSLGIKYVVNQQQKEKKARIDKTITQEKDKENKKQINRKILFIKKIDDNNE